MQATTEKRFEMNLTPHPTGQPGLGVLELRGFLDTRATRDFDVDVQRYVDAGFSRFILDTHKLIYISSAGIGSLVRLSKLLARLGGKVVLLPPSDNAHAIFDLLDFSNVLVFVETPELALKALRGNAS